MIKQMKSSVITGFAFAFFIAYPWWEGVKSIITETEYQIVEIDVNPYLTGATLVLMAFLIVLIYKAGKEVYYNPEPEREESYINKFGDMYVEDEETGTVSWKPKNSPSPTPAEKTPILGYTARK